MRSSQRSCSSWRPLPAELLSADLALLAAFDKPCYFPPLHLGTEDTLPPTQWIRIKKAPRGTRVLSVDAAVARARRGIWQPDWRQTTTDSDHIERFASRYEATLNMTLKDRIQLMYGTNSETNTTPKVDVQRAPHLEKTNTRRLIFNSSSRKYDSVNKITNSQHDALRYPAVHPERALC